MTESCSIACHKLSFSPDESKTYETLREALFRDLINISEQIDGYAFLFPFDAQILKCIADWIPLELKCCPFLRVAISITNDSGITLKLSGPAEVKTFLLQELKLAESDL
ncbi:hypothetical protein E5161_01800 [Cohnella pontilimi]|uniref:Uncharacterized protein n=1 Tax=Cohnella pontilimi TaxID=2564100 RepID=A0A4U0FI76_9BACL|nr:hypothetical protein [Cohnella pontilimi]TJY44154.1 hypothetical protein E5161_01800 [Cohnella pontilimi]